MDRVKDYIRRRGENVSSMEVERIVAQHPDVEEAAAIGVRAAEGASAEDEILICVVRATAAPPDPHELLTFCAERMPYFAVPRYVRLLEELPKTPTKRVRKVELREAGIDARHLRSGDRRTGAGADERRARPRRGGRLHPRRAARPRRGRTSGRC